ncbi:SDR family NAD(P)-dependent oxidoreductase [Streptomyces sp. FH025]|uniref:SDR family NAD(P)-dependent oxidoreductase n=1 Tax=Streptomyces sp. FH025 TaxID=2815937 RepID=UPI001A9EB291|nr:SDR family NAD(P)-dependent oxidoreductase [Streptomyces sp. FH025]MBO1415058.1 SDR family NAD(P)-dependent oxidoreductase [Streptomyces sp. FH025]
MATGSLTGQVALITGGGRGIGREIAIGLAAEGMSVGLLGRTHETLTETLKECAKHGARGVAVTADVTRPGSVREAVRLVERDLGPIDLLVNNAGQVDRAEVPLWETDPLQWWQVVETNLRGPYNLLRCTLPGMVTRRRGRIINLNSGFALRPDGNYTAYATSKGALLQLSDNMADSLARHNIVVLDISPGAVATDMTAGMPMFKGTTEWGSIPYMVAVTVDAARGRFDALHGRFIHAGRDDLEELVNRADAIREADARTLRLRPYKEDDPMA